MKFLLVISCLLVATTVVRGAAMEELIAKYLEYLMPDIQPCSDELQLPEEQARHIQVTQDEHELRQLGCLKACVMKRMSILTGDNDFHLEPIMKMIDVVHAGKGAEIDAVKEIATDCLADIKGEGDECNIGNKYTDCYVHKLMGT